MRVTRTDGGSLRIALGGESIEIRGALVLTLARMVAAAAAWTDALPTAPTPEDLAARSGREGEQGEPA